MNSTYLSLLMLLIYRAAGVGFAFGRTQLD